MVAAKGNQYAKGNKGKPPKVPVEKQPELFEKMLQDFQNHLDTLDQHKSPIFIENWCRKQGITDTSLKRYMEENQEFRAAYNRCRQIQKEILITGGLKGYFNATAFIFTAKNITDMRDKIETEHSGTVKTVDKLDMLIDAIKTIDRNTIPSREDIRRARETESKNG